MHDVHWSEGMLLLPQHLQLFRSFLVQRAELGAQRVGVGCYGVRALEWGVTADSVEVRFVDLTFPSGTVLRIPQESSVAPAPLREALAAARSELDVYLGVPHAQEGVSVVASEGNPAGRFRVQEVEARDEVDAEQTSIRRVMVRRLNARLFLGDEDRTGYECVLIGRVARSSSLEPEPSRSFVPPLLDVTASASLQARLSDLCGLLRKRSEALGQDIASRPFTLAQQTGTDPSSILKLHALNTELGALEQLCLTQGVHPFDTYLALCRLAGSLSLFSDARRSTQLPTYEHDRLDECFASVIRRITELFDTTVVHRHVDRVFEDDDGMPVCRLDAGWLEHGSQMYLSVVGGDRTPEELDRIIGSSVKLFGKSSSRSALAGIALRRMVTCPAALPNRAGVDYFLLDRDATRSEYWTQMQDALAVELMFEGRRFDDIDFQLVAVPKH